MDITMLKSITIIKTPINNLSLPVEITSEKRCISQCTNM